MDMRALWDFSDPEESERRFRAAMTSAVEDEWLILNIQIGRTLGVRRQFEAARQHLQNLEGALETAGAEAQAYYALEWGRTWISAAHREAEQTAVARRTARSAYQRAVALAREAGADGVAIDALHMLAVVETEPQAQLKWGEEALTLATTSDQPDAQGWEASLRHNQGVVLHQEGRYAEALAQFEEALRLREARGNEENIHVARWMVAWTLRATGRLEEALAIQLALAERTAARETQDRYVFEELVALYTALGREEEAAKYRQSA